jgi:Zn-dependent protease with chaperone function
MFIYIIGYILASEISRIQEYRADERAAKIAGSKPMIRVMHICI